MATKKDLIDNELIKEIISIRIDSLGRMLTLENEGRLPGEAAEGATGNYDNKGAIFVPGGLIFEDSDKNAIHRELYKNLGVKKFRSLVRDALSYDNATLLYKDGIATGVNLDNGFFVEIAGTIATVNHLRCHPWTAPVFCQYQP